MAIHNLTREQVVATDLASAWNFISTPANLNRITPPDLDFRIVSEVPEEMYEGLLIEYRIAIPPLGRQTWLTEIKHVRDRRSFVDEQRAGPYRLWYHYHEIREVDGGVRFIDRVTYALPCGPLGSLAHATFVRAKLKTIFDFRVEALERELGGTGRTAAATLVGA